MSGFGVLLGRRSSVVGLSLAHSFGDVVRFASRQ